MQATFLLMLLPLNGIDDSLKILESRKSEVILLSFGEGLSKIRQDPAEFAILKGGIGGHRERLSLLQRIIA